MTCKGLITIGVLLAFLAYLAPGARAEAPETSLRPVAREAGKAGKAIQADPESATQEAAEQRPRKGLFKALRPKKRTERVSIFASKRVRELERGKVCGDRALQGRMVGKVPGRIRGCGVQGAIKLRSVSGIALSQQSVMDCGTAKALKSWVDNGLKPAIGQRGGGVSQIKVVAHYACRTRNNKRGAKISEHGKGRAIDIAAFFLRDGSEISVLKHWGKGWRGKALRKMHKIACGPFGTVLGPNADRYHRDHFHFDTARYRSGSYCK
jgi:hypothetical protein